jgi:hypothetical protein
MFDSVDISQIPAGPAAVAGYVDGSWPTYDSLVAAFPAAERLSISLLGDDAMCADVENGAMRAADVPGWHARQAARGIQRPVVYASAFTMRDQVLPVLAGAGIGLPSVRLWSAHYGERHICGPHSCGALGIDADGTQWTPNALGRNLDQSLLSPGFFTGKLPADWTYSAPLALSATGGHTSARLSWQPPQGFPVLPAAYRIWIYRGTRADKSTLVKTYPRDVTGGALAWEGGGLEQGKLYVAHVAAMAGTDGKRLGSHVYAASLLMTG